MVYLHHVQHAHRNIQMANPSTQGTASAVTAHLPRWLQWLGAETAHYFHWLASAEADWLASAEVHQGDLSLHSPNHQWPVSWTT